MSTCVCISACNMNTRPAKFNWVKHLYLMSRKSTLPVNVSLPFAYTLLLCLTSILACQIQVSVAFFFILGDFTKPSIHLHLRTRGTCDCFGIATLNAKFYLAAPQGFWVSVIAVTAKPASFCQRKCMAHCHTLRVNVESKTRSLAKMVN